MARPANSAITWATVTKHTDPGQPWDNGTKKITPSAAEAAEGFLPGREVPCEWLNALLNSYGDWTAYVEEITAPRVRSVSACSWQGTDVCRLEAREGGYGAGYAGSMWRCTSTATDQWLFLDLVQCVPRNATITQIEVAYSHILNVNSPRLEHHSAPVWSIANPGFPAGTKTVLDTSAGGGGDVMSWSSGVGLDLDFASNIENLAIFIPANEDFSLYDTKIWFSEDKA